MNFLRRNKHKKGKFSFLLKALVLLVLIWITATTLQNINPYFQRFTQQSATKLYTYKQSILNVNSLTQSIELLKRQNSLLSSKVIQQELLIKKIDNLKSLKSKYIEGKNPFILTLKIIDYKGYSQNIIFNLNSEIKASIGDAVINESGIIGTVQSIKNNNLSVKALSDPSSHFAVVSKRTGQHFIAHGLGYNNLIELKFVSDNEDIKEGDIILTSGMGDHLPHGLQVGTVTSVDIPPGAAFFIVKIKLFSQPGYGKYYTLLH